MSRAAIALPILLGIIVVLWGCSPYQSTPSTVPDKALEARVDKLEKELRTAKDQHAVAAADLKAEQGKRAAAEKARDEFQLQVKLRGDELAKAQTDLDGLRKGLKELLGKADAALAPLDPSGVNVSAK
jgi:chromosome segregation ATPase